MSQALIIDFGTATTECVECDAEHPAYDFKRCAACLRVICALCVFSDRGEPVLCYRCWKRQQKQR